MDDDDPVEDTSPGPGGPTPDQTNRTIQSSEASGLLEISANPDNVTTNQGGSSSEFEKLVIDNVSDAIIVVDRIGHIVYANRATTARARLDT